ncbi:MAG TPA: hypothetical protein VLV83_15490 [Acidobacteriota bacterium]|nr:hypothetical protein [Acidobacteriota bacterium]
MQTEILEEHRQEELEVYAIWFNMLAGDSRSGWPEDLLSDPRVQHFWDESRIVGRWYGENVTQKKKGHVEWDAYFLYGPDAVWDGEPEMISWGRTIVSTRTELKEDLTRLFRDRRAQ